MEIIKRCECGCEVRRDGVTNDTEIEFCERHSNEYLQRVEADNAALRARLELARIAYEKLINYRDHNVLNFQLEKADDFIRMIRDAVTPPEAGEVP